MSKSKKKLIMEMLARGNSFQATQWLKNPNKELGNKSPAELMNEEQIEIVFEILSQNTGKYPTKKRP